METLDVYVARTLNGYVGHHTRVAGGLLPMWPAAGLVAAQYGSIDPTITSMAFTMGNPTQRVPSYYRAKMHLTPVRRLTGACSSLP
jgi:hypothetical protein